MGVGGGCRAPHAVQPSMQTLSNPQTHLPPRLTFCQITFPPRTHLPLQAALCHSKVVRMLCKTLEAAPTPRARGAALSALQVRLGVGVVVVLARAPTPHACCCRPAQLSSCNAHPHSPPLATHRLQAFCKQDPSNLRKLVWSGGLDALLGVLAAGALVCGVHGVCRTCVQGSCAPTACLLALPACPSAGSARLSAGREKEKAANWEKLRFALPQPTPTPTRTAPIYPTLLQLMHH